MNSLKPLLIIFFISISAIGQNKWAETHSIVNPVTLNDIKVYDLTPELVTNLFSKPKEIKTIWSEYHDENMVYYIYENSYFQFWPNNLLQDLEIRDKKINNISVQINNHSVGDSLINLKRDYYKSTLNMSDNEVSIHLISSDFCITGSIITFKIANDLIEHIKLIDLN
ncbi:hypothetical protein [Seonamhaeicola maritimus]|uniref:Uncharacterized protein n=1 Tax=Seonamhaeicola maritimus TaxID=2591822 RepID=A0A5C7GH33_9FLAO|nr:hypothetical protein [Seonamhaeicola maritimus]TXG36699.1 hypothetical protein FUA22_08950 [Seonamhaeicola maritimus]